ncbi:hypothetical protein BT96DRAFT_984246 [Gymnopus androsaceus JB14]|uniref:Alpha/beta hydrolase fold-3 domain-containing protein n=1 Tax=Gymnopus androsaceus JB14 TaxID=1447944 RepID=A0A6A4IM43_9AGAR|nr:hypothetical protein BT96DRAFT_984246 [Gymnopus androsaceus JB14]
MSNANEPQPIPKQPLHPSIISKLDPEYVAFHEKYLQFVTPPHTLPWDPVKMRAPAPFSIGSKKPLDVGKIEEYELKMGQRMRAYTPPGEPPINGWPLLVYFHGGWALGGLDSEQSIITNLCVGERKQYSFDDGIWMYRKSRNAGWHPRIKFPAAVEDAVEALQWALTDGKALLNIDISKTATGGVSAGGNLATVLALKSAEASFDPPLPAPMALQLLIVPSLDQTATEAPGGRWESNKHAPMLSPARVNWFKGMYFRSEKEWLEWEASPLLAPEDLLRKAPKAWIAAGEMDILCNEAKAYAEKLNSLGVEAECVVYKGGTHISLILDGAFDFFFMRMRKVTKSGTQGVSDAVNALAKAFGEVVSS